MSLDLATQKKYVELINTIWGGSMQNNSPENITPEVQNILHTVLNSIQSCSKQFAVVDITFNIFYITPTDWLSLIINVGMASPNAGDWIQVLLGNKQYKACVNAAALNWKSIMQMELLGI